MISRVCLLLFVCLYVCLSVCTNNASSPDPGHSISAKYFQTVQNLEELPCLWFFFARYTLKFLHFELASIGTPIDHTQIPGRVQSAFVK